jgi:two-component system, NtrC family, sensor kinase
MFGLLANVSLRAKITATFVIIVLGGITLSVLIGSRIITDALLNQAHNRVNYGLQAARLVYDSRLDRLRRIVARAAVLGASSLDDLPRLFSEQREKEAAIDFFCVASKSGAGGPCISLGSRREGTRRFAGGLPALVRSALQGKAAAGTELLSRAALESAGVDLARLSVGAAQRRVEGGLVLLATAPVAERGGQVGAAFGGVLLNGNSELVDQIKDLIFGRERYEDRDIGAVSIFQEGRRVATNFMLRPGVRGHGTVVSDEVAEAVLGQRARWIGRAPVVGTEYVAAYEPLRDGEGAVIGMLGVGLQVGPLLAVRTDMMLTFLIVAAIGVIVVLGLTYLITRSMIRPLEAMAEGTKRIAAGDLDHAVGVHSRDEIGKLADSFNQMQRSVKTMKAELQGWAHTLEAKVKERTEELVAVQTKMAQSEKLASLGRLSAGVAHEINNPLGGILSFSMLALEDCGEGAPQRESLEIISRQALRCREIVKGLLDFARQSESSASPTDVAQVVDKTFSLLTNQALFHNIKMVKKFEPGLPTVLIDPGQLQQVVMNLVLNAVDAMEQKGTLTVETTSDPREKTVVLRVSDTGKGIPADVLPLIFEPFFTTKKVGQGTGLGLAIVHGIVTRVGGRIEVDTSGEGTSFRVHFPASPPEAGRSEENEA